MTEDDTSLSPSLPEGSGAPGLEGGDPSGGTAAPSPAPEWDALPASWSRDVETQWKATPAEVRQWVHRREQDSHRGAMAFKGKAENYDKLHGVWKEYLDQDPNLDVPGVYQTLAANHLALVKAESPEQRRELFLRLAQNYGVDFATAAAAQPSGGQPADGLTPRQRAELKELLNPVFEVVSTQQRNEAAAKHAEATKAVDTFFSDPKNKYVKEVGSLMAQIVQAGQTKDLAEAYELAVMRTPAVKAKYLADLATGTSPSQPGAGPRNLKSSAEGAPPPTGRTIDDDMNAVAMKAFPGWTPRAH